MLVANNAAQALKAVHGTEYQTGSSPELLYAAAGGQHNTKNIQNTHYYVKRCDFNT